jgi:hypothetical protein
MLKIVITSQMGKRTRIFFAFLEDKPECQETGSTKEEAVGRLVTLHPDKFQIEVESK